MVVAAFEHAHTVRPPGRTRPAVHSSDGASGHEAVAAQPVQIGADMPPRLLVTRDRERPERRLVLHAEERREAAGELLVEGGGGLAAALLRADLVDEIHWMLAPKLIGGDGRAALGPLGLRRLAEAERLGAIEVQQRGEDVHVSARLRGSR